MKSKDLNLLHQKPIPELKIDLEKASAELVDLRFKLKTNQLKNTKSIAKVRHLIAVLKTLIHQKE